MFKQISAVDPKVLNSRKKLLIYDAIGIDKNYYAIFIIDAKSRFLRKNAQELDLLLSKLIDVKGHNYKKKMLLIGSPLCSKAKILLEEQGWSVAIDFM
ncbi:MAG: hypothetical protein U9N30_04970 [Campylobacterota bacterium]|nr:hypothetical protein [Campylobacterota bacterium]